MKFRVYHPASPERTEIVEAESFTYGEHAVMFFAAKLTDYVNPIAGFPAGVIVVQEQS